MPVCLWMHMRRGVADSSLTYKIPTLGPHVHVLWALPSPCTAAATLGPTAAGGPRLARLGLAGGAPH